MLAGDRIQSSAKTYIELTSLRFSAAGVYLALACLLFLGLAAYFIGAIGPAIVDDAYITLVYSRNLANGNGLVWSDGTRVEGYTDFLWVLIGAGAFKLDVDPILLYRITGIASGLALLVAVSAWTRRYSLAPVGARFAPVVLAAMGPVAYWAIAGLEATTYAALAFGGTLCATLGGRHLAAAGFLFFLAALAHPDAVVLLAPVAGYVLVKSREEKNLRGAVGFLTTFALPFGAYWLARWAYFDYPMPNTFYAKDTFSLEQLHHGFQYIMRFAPIAFLPGLYLVFRGFTKGLAAKPETALLGTQLLLWFAYLMYVGGDFMEMGRFMVPILPALAILFQESLWTVASQARMRRTAFAVSGAIVVSVSLFWAGPWTGWSGQLDYSDGRDEVRTGWQELGGWFKAHSEPEALIAVTAAGAIPYFSERPAIDMLGLNDIHIAHEGHIDHSKITAHKRYDGEYVLDRTPEFIVVNNIVELGQPLIDERSYYLSNGIEMLRLPTNDSLFEDDRFWNEYTRVKIAPLAEHHVVMARNDVAAQLISEGAAEPVPNPPPSSNSADARK